MTYDDRESHAGTLQILQKMISLESKEIPRKINLDPSGN